MLNVSNRYYNNERQPMLSFIPSQTKRLLDIGCATGMFGSLVKAELGSEVWGIEINTEAGTKAAQQLDKVLIAPLEQSFSELPKAYFDCIVCNDVLEHLADPYSALKQLPQYLTTDGVLVSSIPNVRYWPNLVDLVLHGNWDYREEGILDRTHLRFFTRNSIIKTFSQYDYEILTIEGINPFWSRSFSTVKRIFRGRFDDCTFLQYAVVARPSSKKIN